MQIFSTGMHIVAYELQKNFDTNLNFARWNGREEGNFTQVIILNYQYIYIYRKENFGVPKKLIKLTEICNSNNSCKVRFHWELSSGFDVKVRLKQAGDALSSYLFNLALEKVIGNVTRRYYTLHNMTLYSRMQMTL